MIPPANKTVKQYFTSLNIIFFAIISAIIIFGIVIYLLNSSQSIAEEPEITADIFYILVPLTMISAIGLSIFIPMKKFEKIHQITDLKEKLSLFRTIFIIKLALLEVPALFALVIYLLSGQIVFLILAGIMVVFLIFQYPNQENIQKVLKLNQAEKEKLTNKNPEIK